MAPRFLWLEEAGLSEAGDQQANRGAWQLPDWPLWSVPPWRRKGVAGGAHRKSGVIKFGAVLSPVESCSLRTKTFNSLLLPEKRECKNKVGEKEDWRCPFSVVRNPFRRETGWQKFRGYLRKRPSRI